MKSSLLSAPAVEAAAHCLKILAHPQRLRMIDLLLKQSRSVGELARLCDIPPNVASEHLRLMLHCRFLESRREGKNVYYEVAERHLEDILKCIRKRFGE